MEFINREKELVFLGKMEGEDELKLKAQKVQWGKKGRRDLFCLFRRKGFIPNTILLTSVTLQFIVKQ